MSKDVNGTQTTRLRLERVTLKSPAEPKPRCAVSPAPSVWSRRLRAETAPSRACWSGSRPRPDSRDRRGKPHPFVSVPLTARSAVVAEAKAVAAIRQWTGVAPRDSDHSLALNARKPAPVVTAGEAPRRVRSPEPPSGTGSPWAYSRRPPGPPPLERSAGAPVRRPLRVSG